MRSNQDLFHRGPEEIATLSGSGVERLPLSKSRMLVSKMRRYGGEKDSISCSSLEELLRHALRHLLVPVPKSFCVTRFDTVIGSFLMESSVVRRSDRLRYCSMNTGWRNLP